MSRLKVTSRTQVFNHPWERVFIERVETEGGKAFDYLISEPNDFVIVVAFLADDRILLVRQYKHGAREELLGFPAGFMQAGETPEACAKRELAEETGYTAPSFRQVAELSENPTRCRNSYYIVFAEDAVPLAAGHSDNGDELEGAIQVQKVPVSRLLSPAILQEMKAGPMLSALPFIVQHSGWEQTGARRSIA